MGLLLLGVSHQSAPVQVRDALAMEPDQVAAFLPRQVVPPSPIRELVVLSTCTRTEFYASVTDAREAGRYLCAAGGERLGMVHLGDDRYAYRAEDADLVHHLFRVAAGLDSLLIGEHQVIAQVREALAQAERAGTAGVLLRRLFQAAVSAGNRARSETGIARGALSVASAAVRMAAKVLGDLSPRRVLLVGAGETGELAARHLAKEGPGPHRLVVLNRTLRRAEALARSLGPAAVARPFDHLETELFQADLVVAATASPEPLIHRRQIDAVARARGPRPLVLVDIGRPRNVDPACGGLPEVFLYDLDSLEAVVEQNRRSRERDIPLAEAILDREADRFLDWHRALQVTPTIRALRLAFEDVARREAERHAKHFHRTDRESLHRFAETLVHKLLHRPTVRIRQLDQASGDGLATLAAVQDLFQLNGQGDAAAPASDEAGS